MNSINKSIVSNFIAEIWNNRQLTKVACYLHPDFTDHSLPSVLSADGEGTKKWIMATSKSFAHETVIEEILGEDDKVMVKIKMNLKHIGIWREIEPTHLEISISGFRYFKLKEGKISEQWALIDGAAIEEQLKSKSHGCKI